MGRRMTSLLDRMEDEPELFTVVDNLFLQVKGETVMVRAFRSWFWSIVVCGGGFTPGRNVVGYHRLTVLQNIRANWAMRKIGRSGKW